MEPGPLRCSHRHDNRVYTCQACCEKGKEASRGPRTSGSTNSPWIGLKKCAWSGYVIECPNCDAICPSQQAWLGSPDPGDTWVQTETVSVCLQLVDF